MYDLINLLKCNGPTDEENDNLELYWLLKIFTF